MMKANIVVVILLVHLLQVLGLRCYKCNQTEIFTRKCVLDSADEVECSDGEVCSYGRTLYSKGRPDLVGCERKDSCDEDRANGVSCETCETDLCNLYSRRVVTYEHKVQIINLPSGTTIIKEEIPPRVGTPQALPVPTDPRPVNNNPGPFPGFNFPFFNMPSFGSFGLNNYGFPGIYQPQQGSVPPYAPFVGFGGPYESPGTRPPYIHEPEAQPPVYAPGQETIEVQKEVHVVKPLTLPPPREESEVTLQEAVLQFGVNNKPSDNEFTTTERPLKAPELVEQVTSPESSIIKDEQAPTRKPPSLATSLLQQFPSSNPPVVEPNRNPSISDLVLNLGSNTNKPNKKPSVQLPLAIDTTLDKNQTISETNEPIDIPVTIPEVIEDINTETPTTTATEDDLPINKDYVAVLNLTKTTLAPNTEETATLVTKIDDDESDFISPTTKKGPLMSRTNDDDDDQIEDEDDDENNIEPSLTEPENLQFNIRSNLKDNTVKQVEEIKFPVVESENYYFDQRTQGPGSLTFEEINPGLPETPVFGNLK